MNNFQTQVIRAQINLLWHIREIHENDLTNNQISWIDDDITYVELKYLDDPNDSSLADEYRIEQPPRISFLSALDMLTTRINNTIAYLEDIIDPEQN